VDEYTVFLTWDDTAKVWLAENDEIPLALECASFDKLLERVRVTAPEILAENGENPDVYLDFVSHRREKADASLTAGASLTAAA
jgi:hypothetical protein